MGTIVSVLTGVVLIGIGILVVRQANAARHGGPLAGAGFPWSWPRRRGTSARGGPVRRSAAVSTRARPRRGPVRAGSRGRTAARPVSPLPGAGPDAAGGAPWPEAGTTTSRGRAAAAGRPPGRVRDGSPRADDSRGTWSHQP